MLNSQRLRILNLCHTTWDLEQNDDGLSEGGEWGDKVRSLRTIQFGGPEVVMRVGNSCINFSNEFTRIIFN